MGHNVVTHSPILKGGAYSACESQLGALFNPEERQRSGELAQRQPARFAAVEDGLDDVRGQVVQAAGCV